MKKNPEEAFLGLLEIHKGILYKISHAYTITPEDRKDLFQEIVVSLWKAYPSFQENSKLSTWIYRVALYTAITNYRRKKNRVQYGQLQPDFYGLPGHNLRMEDEEQIKLLYSAIAKLPSIDKAIILLLLEENTYAEIGNIMGIRPAAIGMRIRRAKDKLAILLINIKS